MPLTAERIREIYNDTVNRMPTGAVVVLEVERRLRARRAAGQCQVGRTRDDLMQEVCEEIANDFDPRARAEALFRRQDDEA